MSNLQVLCGLEHMTVGYKMMNEALNKCDKGGELLVDVLNNEMCEAYQSMFTKPFDELDIDSETQEVFNILGYECRSYQLSGNTIKDFLDGASLFMKGLLYLKHMATELGINGVKIKLSTGQIATLNVTSSNIYAEKDIHKLFFKMHDFKMNFEKVLNKKCGK